MLDHHPPTFVMPFYGASRRDIAFLDHALAGLCAQTDGDWHLVIVDDASPDEESLRHLRALEQSGDRRVTVLFQPVNRGQGHGRNIGTRWAVERGASFVLFHDADDVSHPRRLEQARAIFADSPEVDFVYSTFIPIDENGDEVPEEELTPSIREILDIHRSSPVEGPMAWIRIATETGYATQTSTVAVRSSLAAAQPFPDERGSEDSYTWLCMSAAGTGFRFVSSTPTRYRVTRDGSGSSDRRRLGQDGYYRQMVRMNARGFQDAVDIALSLGKITPNMVPEISQRFHRRLADSMRKEGQIALADSLMAVDA